MKHFFSKSGVLTVMMAGMALAPVQAKTNVKELAQELEIMTNILSTSLKQNNSKQGIRFSRLDVTYLASQGVVFNVNTSNGGLRFNFGNFLPEGFVMPGLEPLKPLEPLEPLTPGQIVIKNGDINIELDSDEMRDLVRNAKREARKAMEQLRELREDEREISWERREYERRRRDIEFEKRHADEKNRKRLNEMLRELDKEMLQLEQKQQEISKFAAELEQEQKQQQQKRAEAHKTQYKRFLAGFEQNIADVMCKYGAGLKALDSKEHVSFVLKNFGSAELGSHSKQDRIYVFKQQDIRACVTEKIDSNKLLTRAQTYLF